MKLKNVKFGQRVQYKGSMARPELTGGLGTIRQSDSTIPYVEWDNEAYNTTTYKGYHVAVEYIEDLRKVT